MCDHEAILQTRTREARPVVDSPQNIFYHHCLHVAFNFVVVFLIELLTNTLILSNLVGISMIVQNLKWPILLSLLVSLLSGKKHHKEKFCHQNTAIICFVVENIARIANAVQCHS